MKSKNLIEFDGINSFDFNISYTELDPVKEQKDNELHIHSECEIYINLTGDVSFLVEDKIYPVKRGDIIITRPHEYHLCLYHSSAIHKHFWILFSSMGNEKMLDMFFDRSIGKNNRIVVSEDKCDELFSVCFNLMKKDTSKAYKYMNFFRLLQYIEDGKKAETKNIPLKLPQDVTTAIEYINENLTLAITVKDIAQAACVSINTLERHFKESVQLTPTQFIKSKRLALAAEMLRNGCSVSSAALDSGFYDISNFIVLFKNNFGITPLKYKKKFEKL